MQSRLLSLLKQRFITTKTDIKSFVNSNDIVVFMKGNKSAPQCGFSRAVVQILELQNVHFESVNVLENQELRENIKEFSNWPTIPQVYIKGEFVGGCDIMINMHQSGELEATLLKENLIKK